MVNLALDIVPVLCHHIISDFLIIVGRMHRHMINTVAWAVLMIPVKFVR